MKKLINLIFGSLFVAGFASLTYGQCSGFAVSPTTATINCGESVDFVGQGYTSGPVLSEDFNNSTLGPGWSTSQTIMYGNPCGPSLDGTPSAWMGSAAAQPRILTTVGFDLQCGAEVCFDLDFAGDENTTNCEDPDAANEGVHFEYSTDNGATWIEIFYFEANGSNSYAWYQWSNYCFVIPPGAWSSNTMFRWRQIIVTGNTWDHWGIDNVNIQPFDCNSNYYYTWDGVFGDNDTTMTFTSSSTFDVLFTNGVDDTCSTTVTVNVNPLNLIVNAGNPNLDCGGCTGLTAALNPMPSISGANYTYTWSPAASLSDPAILNPQACPVAPTNYTVQVVETNTGCTANGAVNVNVNIESAIADFSSSVNEGCAPLFVDFTNNSSGTTYIWDFGDGSPVDNSFEPNHTFNSQGTYIVSLTAQYGGICPDSTFTDTIVVSTLVIPQANFSYDVVCGEPTVNFTNTGTPNLTYSWDFGDGNSDNVANPTHTYATDGTYTVTLTITDPTCGTQDDYTEDITIVNNPLTVNYNPPTCYQFSDGSITLQASLAGSQVYSVLDSNGVEKITPNTTSANLLSAGWYYVSVDFGDCIFTDSVLLEQPPELNASFSITNVACNGDATGVVIVDTVTGYAINNANNYADSLHIYNMLDYNWTPDPAGINGAGINGADSSYNMPAGTYILTINDSLGCSRAFTINISEPPPMTFVQLGIENAYCRVTSSQNGNGIVYAAAGGGVPPYLYEWENLQTGATVVNTTWGSLNPGQYTITAIDNNDCVLQQTVTVDSLNPIADFTMTSAEFTSGFSGTAPVSVHFVNESQYFANPNNPLADTTFYWHFDYPNDPPGWIESNHVEDTFDTTYAVGGTYTVCLRAKNKNGCEDMYCEDIIVYDPLQFTPINIFTPNGDGDNDLFTFIYRADAVSEFHCVVVNRWGKTIREFTSITDTWDGTDKSGSKCNDGVYFYTYEGKADNGEEFSGQGTVTIVGTP